MSPPGVTTDAWAALRRHTSARIALGRAGGSTPTAELLRFALDHAEARDAVHAELDIEALERSLEGLSLPIIRLSTRAANRLDYLQRPDLGRSLDDPSRGRLQALANASPAGWEISLLVGDGLCAQAAQSLAPPLLGTLVPALRAAGYRLAPVAVARYARVALQDDVGSILRAASSVVLLGERPGLHAPVSLGAYLVYDPRPGTTDERRNCVSNIRPAGLPTDAAAATLLYLVTESLRRQISGVHLKDERPPRPLPDIHHLPTA